MRSSVFVAIASAAGLGACAPVPVAGTYGYEPATPAYGYYDGGYAPDPYYAQPAYPGYSPYATPYAAPYAAPYATGGTIIVGGERRFNDRDRYRNDRYRNEVYRNDRPRYDGGFRGNQNPPGRDFNRQPGPQNFGGGRPAPVAINRPPPPAPAPRPGPGPGFSPSPSAHAPEFNPANPTAQGGADR